MNLLSDIITYVRRIIKSPSDAVISDNLIIDYINRFWTMDVDAEMQLFDLKTQYKFMTTPGVDKYNMPLYSLQTEPGSQTVSYYPVYQGFLGPAYINGVPVSFQTEKQQFFNVWNSWVQNLQVVATGTGISTYTLNIPILPTSSGVPQNPPFNGLLRGHIDNTGLIAIGSPIQDPPLVTSFNTTVPVTSVEPMVYISSIDAFGKNVVVCDSGQFLSSNVNYGLLMQPGAAPLGNIALTGVYGTTVNTINYFTGVANVTFPSPIPNGNNINVNCYYYQSGLPRAILFYNNVLTLRSPPALQYLIELEAYLSPAAFLSSGAANPFAYMSEYIARGAARKILSDTGDIEQFMFYEPLFKEQRLLVWKRSQRQWTANRTQTIYSQGTSSNSIGFNGFGGTL